MSRAGFGLTGGWRAAGARLDGSHSQDGTALIACTEDLVLVPVEIIERPARAEDWRVDRSRIERALETMFSDYSVSYLYADPWRWQDELEAWTRRFGDKVVEFPTNSIQRMAPAVDRFRTALQEGRISHSGDEALTPHVPRIGSAKMTAPLLLRYRLLHRRRDAQNPRHSAGRVVSDRNSLPAYVFHDVEGSHVERQHGLTGLLCGGAWF